MAAAGAPPPPPPPRLRLQLASDIHAEFYGEEPGAAAALGRSDAVLAPRARHLALLGDIGLIGGPELREFVFAAAERFERVFVVAGNHEHYSPTGSIEEAVPFSERRRELAELCAASPGGRVTLLDRTSALVDGVRILGCTLWSDVPDAAAAEVTGYMRDFQVICPDAAPAKSAELRGLRWERARVAAVLAQLRAEHARDAAWLADEVRGAAARGEDVVVLTHHAPFFEGTSHPAYGRNASSHAFATDMSSLFARADPAAGDGGGGVGVGGVGVGVGGVGGVGVGGGGAVAEPAKAASTVRAWAFGHTHYCTDFVPAGFTTRLVANQRGYRDSVGSSFYRPDFVLEVP